MLIAGISLTPLSPPTTAAAHDNQTSSMTVENRGPPAGLVLIIRHAEKPGEGRGLAPAGQHRADAYTDYFQHLRVDGSAVHIDTLVATADTTQSDRPRLTLTPLSRALNVPIQQPFADNDVRALAKWLASQPAHRTILVAWHHGRLPELLGKLGVSPGILLPDGIWPGDRYGWVIALRYDAAGRLVTAKRITEPDNLVGED